jgi:hypothetical protein
MFPSGVRSWYLATQISSPDLHAIDNLLGLFRGQASTVNKLVYASIQGLEVFVTHRPTAALTSSRVDE